MVDSYGYSDTTHNHHNNHERMDGNPYPKVWNGIFGDNILRAFCNHRIHNVSYNNTDFGRKSTRNTRKGSIKNTETQNLTLFFYILKGIEFFQTIAIYLANSKPFLRPLIPPHKKSLL